jgi:uncharacterized protein YdhG (YjbR/CyaY superfamily)
MVIDVDSANKKTFNFYKSTARMRLFTKHEKKCRKNGRGMVMAGKTTTKITTIDEYLGGFEPGIQKTLQELRNLIRAEAPEALEKISYGMPTFYLNGNLVHFAAFKDHYGFFPNPSGIDEFEEELAPYRSGKGTLRFPFGEPIPWDLLKKVIRHRVKVNSNRVKTKAKKASPSS